MSTFENLPILKLVPEPLSLESGYFINYTIIDNNIILDDKNKENCILDFVLKLDCDFFIGLRHLLLADNIKGVGSIKINNGKINWISNDSGHYKPTDFQLKIVINFFQLLGFINPNFLYINYQEIKID